ncbi:MAG: ShlB/FhaC/HecB family hemolysin secretion/activation protein [Symploca sp. SIO2B6]|nr:ShlB/FhaC/HecB family hemolysin secretion/activation protein [Symploca sp. SIO2B6]
MQLDPFIQRVNAELTAGSTPGQNLLLVDVEETSPWVVGLDVNNYRSPSIGSNQLSATVGRNNLIGVGDRLSTTYGFTEGLDILDTNVSIPVNPREGILSFSFNRSDSQIITEEFKDLEIESETRSYSLSFRQPVVRSPNTELGIGLGLDLRRRQTFILDDEPFSFSEGAEDGETNATIVRFFQDWVQRSPRQVLAARSQFSVGLDAFDATVNDSGTDARFFSWIGQFQWVRQIASRNLIIGRISTQLTPDSLLSLEQFSIGGVNTVRGYSQNQRVADNGVLVSLEARIPITKNPQHLQLAPFLEAGTVWNNRTPDPEDATLMGTGIGIRWAIRPDLIAQIDWGIPLIAVDDASDSLQSNGVYFSLRYQPF